MQINIFDRGEIQNFKEFVGAYTIFDIFFPTNNRWIQNEFMIDKTTPQPSKLKIERFSGEEGKEIIMAG